MLLLPAIVLLLSTGAADVLVGRYLAYVREQELIMILPFRNLSGSTDDAYLVDAIAGDLTDNLARARQGHVISSQGHSVLVMTC